MTGQTKWSENRRRNGVPDPAELEAARQELDAATLGSWTVGQLSLHDKRQ